MKILFLALGVVVLTASPALASLITIAFEEPSSFASLAEFYNGGTDSNGVAGPNLGVSFGLDDLALQNDVLGPYFSNAPSPLGVMASVGPETAMNVAAGFKSLSFLYSSPADVADGVQVWSGLNGTGTLLASFNLTTNALASGPDRYGNWDQLFSSAITEVAQSVTFATSVGFAGSDDVGFTPVLEPSGIVLFSLGVIDLWPLYCRHF